MEFIVINKPNIVKTDVNFFCKKVSKTTLL